MTKIYIIRHCEGLGNVMHIFSGTTDTDISEVGVSQLEKLTERFKDIHLDAVYSSPLIRAKKTAHAVADIKGLPLIVDPAFIELHGGIVEGEPFAETFKKYPDLAKTWDKRPQDFGPEDAETMRNAYERIYEAVIKVARNNTGKTVAIATHGGVIKCLLARLLFGTIERLVEVPWCENTDVSLIEVDDDFNMTVKYYNDHSHLEEEMLPINSRINSYINVKGESSEK